MQPCLQKASEPLFKEFRVISSNFATCHSIVSTPFQGQSKSLWKKSQWFLWHWSVF